MYQKKLKKFKIYTIGIELINQCKFNCYFCNPDKKIFSNEILSLEEFKKRVDFLIKQGFTHFDLTPTIKGDIFLIKNIDKYFEYLENKEEVKHYFAYFSLVNNEIITDRIKRVCDILNKSKKGKLLYSCYWSDGKFETFSRITRVKNKNHFNIHKKNTFFFLKNIRKNFVFVDRVGKISNIFLQILKSKNIKVIYEDNDIQRENINYNEICTQLFNCTLIKINGDITLCHFGEAYDKAVIGNINNYIKNNTNIERNAYILYSKIKPICQKCKYYVPLDTDFLEQYKKASVGEY